MSEYGPCPTCGANSKKSLVAVWEDAETYETHDPDYVGCTECQSEMREYE